MKHLKSNPSILVMLCVLINLMSCSQPKIADTSRRPLVGADQIRLVRWTSMDYPLFRNSVDFSRDTMPDLGVISMDGSGANRTMMGGRYRPVPGVTHVECVLDFVGTYFSVSRYVNLDPVTGTSFMPWDVVRLDASRDGTCFLTNKNGSPPPVPGATITTDQIWSQFDGNGNLVNTLSTSDEDVFYKTQYSKPLDVCNDFGRGRYVLLTTPEKQYVFLGTEIASQGEPFHVPYHTRLNLDPVSNQNVKGMDVFKLEEGVHAQPAVRVFIFTTIHDRPFKIYVFDVVDDKVKITDNDSNVPVHKINVDSELDLNVDFRGYDLELLPPKEDYHENPDGSGNPHPILCVLISWPDPLSGWNGAIMLYDTGSWKLVETIGSLKHPVMARSRAFGYLDTNDSGWEIHVTRMHPKCLDLVATVFSY